MGVGLPTKADRPPQRERSSRKALPARFARTQLDRVRPSRVRPSRMRPSRTPPTSGGSRVARRPTLLRLKEPGDIAAEACAGGPHPGASQRRARKPERRTPFPSVLNPNPCAERGELLERTTRTRSIHASFSALPQSLLAEGVTRDRRVPGGSRWRPFGWPACGSPGCGSPGFGSPGFGQRQADREWPADPRSCGSKSRVISPQKRAPADHTRAHRNGEHESLNEGRLSPRS